MTLPSGNPGVYWNQFTNGGNAVAGDQLVGLRNGTNYRFSFNDVAEITFQREIAQSAHGLTAGQAVKISGSATYATAQADASANANTVGMVSSVIDADHFVLFFGGYLNTGVSALTPGVVYFLDPSVAGGYTSTAPTTPGQIRLPLFVAETATTAYWINNNAQQL
jgi:hypothetical protein